MEDKALINGEKETKIEELIKYIRKTSLFRQVVPMEAAAGWPIPIVKNDEVYVSLPFYGITTRKKGETVIYPPMCTITVKWTNNTIVEYANLRYNNPWPEGQWEKEAGIFPHPALSNMTVRQYKEKKKELMELYDKMLDGLEKKETLSQEEETKFKILMQMLMEPALVPFYRSLNPAFFSKYF